RLQPEVFLRESVADAAPMERGTTDGHRPRHDIPRRLVLDVIAGPHVLAVVEVALAVLEPVLEVEQPLPRFDDDDRDAGLQLGQLFGHHRGGDSTADDEDVAVVGRHHRPRCASRAASGAGAFSEPSSPRQLWVPIAALYPRSRASSLAK